MSNAARSAIGLDDAPVSFPLDSFRDAAPHLRRPFTAAAVKFKVQATWPKNEPTGGLIVSYIDARLVVERLNLIVPHLWWDEYQHDGSFLVCRLTVDNVVRHDVGEGTGKGLYSDALKRAAVKFGVGVSLYAVPKLMLNVSDGHLKSYKDTLQMTPAGEARVRSIYTTWLRDHGSKAFGEPLDHGDSADAQGDAEIEDDAPAPDEKPLIVVDPVPDYVTFIKAAAQGLTARQIRGCLQSLGMDPTHLDTDPPFRRVEKEKSGALIAALKGIVR